VETLSFTSGKIVPQVGPRAPSENEDIGSSPRRTRAAEQADISEWAIYYPVRARGPSSGWSSDLGLRPGLRPGFGPGLPFFFLG